MQEAGKIGQFMYRRFIRAVELNSNIDAGIDFESETLSVIESERAGSSTRSRKEEEGGQPPLPLG